MTATDEDIMNLVVKGDIKKASVLFDRYHVNVYSYLLKVNRDKMLAEDLTQNVFEKMIKYKSSFDGKKSFKAWLFTIVRNANIDHHRKRKYDSLDDSYLQVESTERDAQKQLESKEGSAHLMAAINMLPEEEKEILMLSKFERLKYAEISRIMGLSESALKVKAHRSIKKLRTILVNDLRYEY
ncbi:MAG: RNA polymerase sigma factor [Bacteroidota bacterium]